MIFRCILSTLLVGQLQTLLFAQPHYNKNIPQFQHIADAENSGLVTRVFPIVCPGFRYAYNPALLKDGENYLLIFRYEPFSNKFTNDEKSFLGAVSLDKNFKALSPGKLLDMWNMHVEDPRVFLFRGETYIVHSHVRNWKPLTCDVGLAKMDAQQRVILSFADLGYKLKHIEKNWTPFTYKEFDKEEELFFIYSFNPYKILKLINPASGTVTIAYEKSAAAKALTNWENTWGEIRGGTPAIKINDREYLSFFHSVFFHDSLRHYVMGAIVFDATPPFSLKYISKHPILFKDIYSTPVTKHTWFYPRPQRVIFPTGLVEGVEGNRQVFYVVCGENDVAIKCVVIDKDILLQSLEEVAPIHTHRE